MKYTFTYFLQNKDFIYWRTCPSKELAEYWTQFLKTHPESKPELEKAIRIYNTLNRKQYVLSPSDKEELLVQIKQSTSRKSKVRRLHYFAASLAALLIVAFGLTYIKNRANFSTKLELAHHIANYHAQDPYLITSSGILNLEDVDELYISPTGELSLLQNSRIKSSQQLSHKDNNRLIVPYGKRISLSLSDNSRIWLNAASELSFPTIFNGERAVTAEGELYAAIHSDPYHPFNISSPSLNIVVKGTEFNLQDYPSSKASVVVLVKGRVDVSTHTGVAKTLQPNFKFTYNNQTSKQDIDLVDVREYISWKEGYLYANQTPIYVLINRISTIFDIEFEYDSTDFDDKKTFSGTLLIADINQVVNSLTAITKTTYSKTGNKIHLNKKPMK